VKLPKIPGILPFMKLSEVEKKVKKIGNFKNVGY